MQYTDVRTTGNMGARPTDKDEELYTWPIPGDIGGGRTDSQACKMSDGSIRTLLFRLCGRERKGLARRNENEMLFVKSRDLKQTKTHGRISRSGRVLLTLHQGLLDKGSSFN